jgi:CRISPR-associated protein Cmr2
LEEEEAHQAHYFLSDDLGQFTGRVHQIVTEGQGRVIYAGGDDLLALFPLQTAVQTAQKLAQAYQDVFQGWQQEKDGEPFPFTASAGLAIVHHLYPLDAALKGSVTGWGQVFSKVGCQSAC